VAKKAADGYVVRMSKAFKNEDNDTEEELEQPDPLPAGLKNYMTPAGFQAMQAELRWLRTDERPKIVELVAWAASLGDRSENADYHYNKKRLREIDRRLRYLTKRLENTEVVDPRRQQHLEQVFFGATVTYSREDGSTLTVTLVGVDEADLEQGRINWTSPVARALMKKSVGEVAELRSPQGVERLEIIEITYLVSE
jgi:transcription elongation factor GreB